MVEIPAVGHAQIQLQHVLFRKRIKKTDAGLGRQHQVAFAMMFRQANIVVEFDLRPGIKARDHVSPL